MGFFLKLRLLLSDLDLQQHDIGNVTSRTNRAGCIYGIRTYHIRESVDSLCRDGADAQYMQYLSKSRITSLQTH